MRFHMVFHGAKTYSQWLADAGLKALRVDLIEKDMSHPGKEGLAGWIRSTWLPYLERVPPSSKERFIEDIVESYLEHHPLDDDGNAHVRMMRLEVELINSRNVFVEIGIGYGYFTWYDRFSASLSSLVVNFRA